MSPPNAQIHLTAERRPYSLGERIKGTVEITSKEELIVNKAFVYLTCNESVRKIKTLSGSKLGEIQQSEYWDKAVIYATSCKIGTGSGCFPHGSKSYEFTLVISPAAKETLYSIDHKVKWLLFAVLTIQERPSVKSITYEVEVTKPQISQSSPIVMKEITKEIVLIPCSYCSGLMPQTSIFCPNCGARRKS